MAIGLGILGLEPRVFWSMTMKEIEVVLNAHLGRGQALAPPSQIELSALMKRYPDHRGSNYGRR